MSLSINNFSACNIYNKPLSFKGKEQPVVKSENNDEFIKTINELKSQQTNNKNRIEKLEETLELMKKLHISSCEKFEALAEAIIFIEKKADSAVAHLRGDLPRSIETWNTGGTDAEDEREAGLRELGRQAWVQLHTVMSVSKAQKTSLQMLIDEKENSTGKSTKTESSNKPNKRPRLVY